MLGFPRQCQAPQEVRQVVGQDEQCEQDLVRDEVLAGLAVGNSGTGKTHLAIALGLAACHEGRKVKFFTAAGLVTALTEARDDRALLRFKKQLARWDLVIVDEFGYVPFSKTGAELLFEFFAERYERGSVMVTTVAFQSNPDRMDLKLRCGIVDLAW